MIDIIVSSLILAVVALLLTYLLFWKDDKTSSIPYVTNGRYPVVGHLFSFLADRTKFLMDCRTRYGSCFTIKLLTQRMTFVLSPSDWPTIIRNQSFYFPDRDFATKLFDSFHNAVGYAELDKELHRLTTQCLKNRDGLSPMIVEFVRQLRQQMIREKTILESSGTKSQWISSGLLEFSHHMLFGPSSIALFGEIDPLSLDSDFRLFDSRIHYFFAFFPGWIYSLFFRRELETRSRLNQSWFKKLHPPHESEFIRARTTILLSHPEWFPKKEFGGAQTSIFWGSLGNSIPAVFWCLFYILQDVKALEAIKQEIDTYLPLFSLDDEISNSSAIEDWNPDRLASCIYLDSAVNETLRLVASPMVMRICSRETDIILKDGRTLHFKPNDAVALFPSVAHFDADIFPDPTKFVFDRFAHRNADTVAGFMPFGGGKNICPGRFFVRNEIKIGVAVILRFLDFKFLDTETIPVPQPHRIGVGVAPPTKDLPIMYRYKV